MRRGWLVMAAAAPADPSAAMGSTLTIRLPADAKRRLEALAVERGKAARTDGSEITATSLARGAVLRMLEDDARAKGTSR